MSTSTSLHAAHHIVGVLLALLGAASFAQAAETADPYVQLPRYTLEQERTVPLAIETEIQTAKPAQLPAIEAKLLAVLQSPTATKDAKGWVCRQLRQIGSERAVPALMPLLADETLATHARWALQSIRGAQVDAALRDAVGRLAGRLRSGVILTIGARHDRAAVPVLAPLAASADLVVADSALFALGQIGGAAALDALQRTASAGPSRDTRFHALLTCAASLTAENEKPKAAKTYQAVYQQANKAVIRIAALGGLLAVDKAQGVAAARAALKADQAKLRLAAAKLVCEQGGAALLKSALAELSTLPTDVQRTLIAGANDRAALPAALHAVRSGDAEVRKAAIEALGRLGDAASAAVLLETAVSESELRAPARSSLVALPGAQVDAALLAAAKSGPTPLRVEALHALAGRAVPAAEAALLAAAKDADASVRAEAFAGLAAVGQAKSLPKLVNLLIAAPGDADRAAAEETIAAVCRRIDDKPSAAEPLLAVMSGAAPAARAALLRLAAGLPTPKTLAALRAALDDADPAVADAAIRALAAWPDAAALDDLRQLAAKAPRKAQQVLALRGFVRLAAASGRSPQEIVKLLEQAMTLAARADEKKLALAALGEAPHPAGLELALRSLNDKDLEVEAATAIVRIAKGLRGKQGQGVEAAIRQALARCRSAEARRAIENAFTFLDDMVNIAPTGKASSPDGLQKDGAAGGDQAGIDGDPATYWDKQDNQPLYRFVVTFAEPQPIAAISLRGHSQHKFAAKDFEILCDGKPVKKVVGAKYDDNFLAVRFAPLTCRSVELKITGCYGGSPAIRELGIYRPNVKKDAAK